jgi:PAS domain-containing protein
MRAPQRRPNLVEAIPNSSPDRRRVAALEELDIIASGREERFDRLARLAAATMNVPTSFITLLTATEQVFKAGHNWDKLRDSREHAFCNIPVATNASFVVPDSSREPLLKGNPYTRGPQAVRFYVGAPIHAPGGEAVGALCVIDANPRPRPTPEQIAHLEMLAGIASDELALTDALRRAGEAQQSMLDAAHAIPNGLIMVDAHDRLLVANRAFERMFGLSGDSVKQGAPLSELFTLLAMTGLFPDAEGRERGWVEEWMEAIKPGIRRIMLTDGRELLITTHRKEHGGFISLWTPVGSASRAATQRALPQSGRAIDEHAEGDGIDIGRLDELVEDLGPEGIAEMLSAARDDIEKRSHDLVRAKAAGDEQAIAYSAAVLAAIAGNIGALAVQIAAQTVIDNPSSHPDLVTLFNAIEHLKAVLEAEIGGV